MVGRIQRKVNRSAARLNAGASRILIRDGQDGRDIQSNNPRFWIAFRDRNSEQAVSRGDIQIRCPEALLSLALGGAITVPCSGRTQPRLGAQLPRRDDRLEDVPNAPLWPSL